MKYFKVAVYCAAFSVFLNAISLFFAFVNQDAIYDGIVVDHALRFIFVFGLPFTFFVGLALLHQRANRETDSK